MSISAPSTASRPMSAPASAARMSSGTICTTRSAPGTTVHRRRRELALRLGADGRRLLLPDRQAQARRRLSLQPYQWRPHVRAGADPAAPAPASTTASTCTRCAPACATSSAAIPDAACRRRPTSRTGQPVYNKSSHDIPEIATARHSPGGFRFARCAKSSKKAANRSVILNRHLTTMVNNHPEHDRASTCRSGRSHRGVLDHETQLAYRALGRRGAHCRCLRSRPTTIRRSSSTSRPKRCRSRSAPAGICAATSATISVCRRVAISTSALRSGQRDLQPDIFDTASLGDSVTWSVGFGYNFTDYDPRRLHVRRLPRELRRHHVERMTLRSATRPLSARAAVRRTMPMLRR